MKQVTGYRLRRKRPVVGGVIMVALALLILFVGALAVLPPP